jgi:ubiquinone/menaquinone biosynthesis C-methylase UbiE
MLYSSNNAAKQWILEKLGERFKNDAARILDLACGSAWVWEGFLVVHPNANVVGVDFDVEAIEKGIKYYAQQSRIELRIGDAQRPIEIESYDAVIALSAIEHVVDRKAFLEVVYRALKPGGIAYLNYDVGHFRSLNLKERIMVPVSQVLAFFGKEHWYMKRVDDRLLRSQAELIGFRFVELRKHNIAPLKGVLRNASEETIRSWYAFEESLGVSIKPEELDRAMLSTTIVLQKP